MTGSSEPCGIPQSLACDSTGTVCRRTDFQSVTSPSQTDGLEIRPTKESPNCTTSCVTVRLELAQGRVSRSVHASHSAFAITAGIGIGYDVAALVRRGKRQIVERSGLREYHRNRHFSPRSSVFARPFGTAGPRWRRSDMPVENHANNVVRVRAAGSRWSHWSRVCR